MKKTTKIAKQKKSNTTKQLRSSSNKFISKISKRWLALIVFGVIGTYLTLSISAASTLKPVEPNSRFAWLLQGAPNEKVMDAESGPKVYDFDYLNSNATQIASIKAKGITVICYFSAGTDEDWRPDHSQFLPGDTFGQLPGWEGELIVDTRSANVRSIMYNRIQTMSSLGCDGIEPDNVDAYTNASNIPLNETTTLDYLQFLTNTGHSFNLSVALKNSGDLVNKNLPNGKSVISAHDFAIVEQCYEYNECDTYKPFVNANKAVFVIEYKGGASSWPTSASCKDASIKNYDAYLMNLDLNGPRTPCRTSGDNKGSTTNLPPTISISSPVNGQEFAAGSSITLSANANDTDGAIKQVEFFNGDTSISVNNTAPYSTTVSGLAPGTHSLRAVATDNSSSSNNNKASTSLSITVLAKSAPPPPNNIAPTVTLKNPAATIVAPAYFTLTAGANDQDGTISKVEFYSANTKIGTDTSSPYSFSISNYPAGTYTFKAKATDDKGLDTTSSGVVVTVTTTQTVSGNAPVWPSNASMKSGFDTNWWKNNCSAKSKCKIYVSWPFATDDNQIKGYEVWRSTDNKPAVKLYVNSPDDQYYTDNINKTSNFNYRVFAVDRDGNRAAGPSKSVKIKCTLAICKL
ncbi:endo alpha-1,4 polygalactosaminidase [Candidatus Saccharibacteria bacterium]|nr:endo alpha-1,4 polygalactosaminidase [Candidatus Saccharibacteria bacterium]MBI3337995.1 endo alpha-1,4 polygalactosaminidase [Candidatus Saccharibacteria bacterium]